MISAVVFTPDAWTGEDIARQRETVVRSLVWLVSAVVSGVVRDVTLAVPSGLGLSEVADQSGCALIQADSEAERIAQAVRGTREARLLVILAGFQPDAGLIEEIGHFHAARAGGRDRRPARDAGHRLAAPLAAAQWRGRRLAVAGPRGIGRRRVRQAGANGPTTRQDVAGARPPDSLIPVSYCWRDLLLAGKRVAAVDLAGVEPLLQPRHPLRGRAVRETIRRGVAA